MSVLLPERPLCLRASKRAPAARLLAVAFANDLAVACVGLGVQQYAIRLGAPPVISGLLGMCSAGSYTLGCLWAGAVTRRWGCKRPTIAANALCGSVWLLMLGARSPFHLLALVPFSGFSLSLLWPPLQTWLSDFAGGDRRRLSQLMALFNVSWTAGIMAGPLVAGFVWDFYWPLAFLMPAALAYGCLVLLASTPTPLPCDLAVADDAGVASERARLFLYLAWLGNFASWYARGTVNSLFPQLAKALGFSAPLLGVLIFLLSLAQFVMFSLTQYDHRWQYRLRPLLLAGGAGCVGMMIAAVAWQPAIFAAAFATTGLASGVTYASSLLYALDGARETRGRRSGWHEAVLGSGIVVGPLIGGLVAQTIDLHAPFATAGIVFALTLVAQMWLWRRAHRRM